MIRLWSSQNLKDIFKVIICVLIINLFIFSCAPDASIIHTSSIDQQNSQGVTPPSPTPIPLPDSKMTPLAWEKSVKNSNLWSAYIYSVISLEEPQMLNDNAATDVTLFCPNYASLSKEKRLNFWGQLFAAVAKFESAWNPKSRMIETTMGTDPITGMQVASEGLLQLSYQDSRSYGQSACNFDWSLDKEFAIQNPSDSRKTILDPYKNLRCGIKIFAKILKRKQLISFDDGAYWAVLRKTKRNNVPEISAITKSLPFCVN